MVSEEEKTYQWGYQPSHMRVGYVEPHKDKGFVYFITTEGKKFRVPEDEIDLMEWEEVRDNLIPVADLKTKDLYAILEDHRGIRATAQEETKKKKPKKKKKAKAKAKKRVSPKEALASLDKDTLALLKEMKKK